MVNLLAQIDEGIVDKMTGKSKKYPHVVEQENVRYKTFILGLFQKKNSPEEIEFKLHCGSKIMR